MRVIAGSARRLALVTPPGLDTRPTTDRIKETLFNILQPDIYGCRFLDLFAGSGQIGIEALSRGASFCVFADRDRAAVSCIRQNLEHTRLADKALIYQTDALSAVARMQGRQEPFDIIFMDPPYHENLEVPVLTALAGTTLAAPETTVIVEAAIRDDLDFSGTGFEPVRVKEYKTNKHYFLKRIQE
ncbi:MAG: 16S rRNA (guanine(966)-N(2))-methyltransferase RsmD [Lachnospiraceae bacterium]|jgi:16S rRNA (guanine966-N2)-methyltransferase